MVENPLVSIIIPVYNRDSLVGNTLDSIIDQSYSKWEAIVVDDGSTDNTIGIIKKYTKKDSRIKLFSRDQSPKGAPTCRNIGIEKSQGKYIQFLDSDDLLSQDKIEKQICQLQNENFNMNVISTCQHKYFVNDLINNIKEESSTDKRICKDYDQPMELLIDFWKYLTGFGSHCWLCHKTLLDKIGGWNEDLSINDDGEYFSRVLSMAKMVRFCPDTVVYYRHVTGSMSTPNSHEKRMDQLKAVRIITEIMKSYRFDDDVRKAILNCYKNYMWPDGKDLKYMKTFIADLKSIGYNFDTLGRSVKYKLLYYLFGKKIADFIYIKFKTNNFQLSVWI